MTARTMSFPEWDRSVRSWGEIAATSGSLHAPLPVELTVVRHGQTTDNQRRLITGTSDPPLTCLGLEQAAALSHSLAPHYDIAFHSRLRRSRETLEAAIGHRPVDVVLGDPRIAERSMGVLEGRPALPLPAYDRGDLFWAPQAGEPYADLTLRVASFLLDLLVAAIRAGRTLHVFIASHVGTMRILYGILERITDPVTVLTQQFPNASPILFKFGSTDWPAFLDREAVGL